MSTFTYSFPYALHVPTLDEAGQLATGVAGNGSSVNGNQMPMLDTLYGVMNPTATSQTFRLRFFNQDGTPALWGDGSEFHDYTLSPTRSIAFTFIPDNVFHQPPQNFRGYGTMEADADLPVYSLIGGGGFFPDHWNIISANVPVYRQLQSSTSWRFGYLIPYFNDYNHANEKSYRTELVITNFDAQSASFWITYTVADFYAGAGDQYLVKLTVAAGQSVNYDVYTLLETVGYVASVNSEGNLSIEAHASAVSTSLQSTKAAPMLIHWNRDKTLFSGGQGFWQ